MQKYKPEDIIVAKKDKKLGNSDTVTNGEKERRAQPALRDANKESTYKMSALCGFMRLSA